MSHIQTIDAPHVSVTVEPADELTPLELERIIRLARDAKRGGCSLITITPSTKNGGLFIKAYRNAA